MPTTETAEALQVTVISYSQSTTVEEVPNTVESEPELTLTAEVKCSGGQKHKQRTHRPMSKRQ